MNSVLMFSGNPIELQTLVIFIPLFSKLSFDIKNNASIG